MCVRRARGATGLCGGICFWTVAEGGYACVPVALLCQVTE